jgi:hypothetical protein
MRRALATSLILLGACAPDPSLRVEGEGKVLTVGQRASLHVTRGDPDGSRLDPATFVLTDAAKRTLGPTAPGLELAPLSPWEIGFAIPPGISPGPATLTVGTARGPVFSAGLTVERVVAVRDLTGKVWLTSLAGAPGSLATLAELSPAQAGAGSAQLALSPSGRLLAMAGAELRLAAIERPPRVSAPLVLAVATRDVALTALNATLIASDQGLHLVEPPSQAIDDKTALKLAATPVLDRPTLAIAVDRSGSRGAALTVDGTPPRYELVLLNLQASPPAVLTRVPLAWPVDAAATVDLALSPDGAAAVVVSSAQGTVAILRHGAATASELALPSGQTKPVAVSAARAGLFRVLSLESRGILALSLEGGGRFETSLELKLPGESGAPVALAASANDELVALFERELVLVAGAAAPLVLKPASGLFADKTKADPGVSLALQP